MGRRQLGQAAALGAVNMNLARALGPALGGAVVATAGAGWVFAFDAASYLSTAAVLARWRGRGVGQGAGSVHRPGLIRAARRLGSVLVK
ncbi:MFS transporter [Streptomyces sp. DH7]|uniref:MFS transporter n=1 Tax=Streptomyces sp. DH7 TaxID=2857006 RepID=UPI0027E1A89A|nr:MFS transporter [Streptomyces sp. DH7]